MKILIAQRESASSLSNNKPLIRKQMAKEDTAFPIQNMSENDYINGLREENHRLKQEITRLREEAREKNILISALESQIGALVLSGRDSNDIGSDGGESAVSHIDSVGNVISPSLSPPRRSTIEMKHPPAPIEEPCRRTFLVPTTSRKTCFQSGTAAIKALPRELSILNHSNYLNDDHDSKDDDDNYGDVEQEQQSEKYEVIKIEFMDAYNSRGIYTGTVQRSTQMPHGKGTMIYHKGGRVGGRYYDGDWHMGHWHGNGIIRDADGDIYHGQVVNGLKEGIGKIQFTDGRVFEGKFRQDEASEGTMSYIDGAQYTGELHHGNRHGFGIYRFSDGSFYEGESVMNLFEGKGKMTWSDGGWYQGDWCRGEIHGFGKEYRHDGSLRHDGRWIKGVPIRTKNRR